MINVGLTGGMASGKNFIAGLFEKKGCYTVDADEISREVMCPDGAAFAAIVKAFGREILTDAGEINRASLRGIVTQFSEKRRLLESIVHPAVIERSKTRIKEIAAKDNNAIIINHAPLLLESPFVKNKNNIIVLVWCSPETQKARLLKRGYPPYEEGLKLMEAQMPYKEKLEYAHHVINNDGTPEEAQIEVERVYNLLKTFEYTEKLNRRSRT